MLDAESGLRLAHHFSRVRKMKIWFSPEQDAKKNLPTCGGLLEIVGGETQQRFFDTWGLCVVVVVCVCIATSWDLQNAAVGFQAEFQSSWCHVCTSDSGFKSALCNRNTQLRTVSSAHYSGAWIARFIACQVLTYNLDREIRSKREWQLLAKQSICSGLACS